MHRRRRTATNRCRFGAGGGVDPSHAGTPSICQEGARRSQARAPAKARLRDRGRKGEPAGKTWPPGSFGNPISPTRDHRRRPDRTGIARAAATSRTRVLRCGHQRLDILRPSAVADQGGGLRRDERSNSRKWRARRHPRSRITRMRRSSPSTTLSCYGVARGFQARDNAAVEKLFNVKVSRQHHLRKQDDYLQNLAPARATSSGRW